MILGEIVVGTREQQWVVVDAKGITVRVREVMQVVGRVLGRSESKLVRSGG